MFHKQNKDGKKGEINFRLIVKAQDQNQFQIYKLLSWKQELMLLHKCHLIICIDQNSSMQVCTRRERQTGSTATIVGTKMLYYRSKSKRLILYEIKWNY